MGLVDLHSHVLPAVDDGPGDLESSLALVRGLADLGFTRVTATPHQKANQFLPDLEDVRAAHRALAAALAASGVPVELGLAAENYWDEVFFQRVQGNAIPRYDDGRAFLFEIGTGELPTRFEESIFLLATRGLLPVLAHPERYGALRKAPERLEHLARSCALVVDLPALAGHHGFFTARLARQLLGDRIAHAAASDVHTLSDVREVAGGIAWIRKKLGARAVDRYLVENPRCILTGSLPES